MPKSPNRRAKFPPHTPLRAALEAEVKAHLDSCGLPQKGGLRIKAAVIFLWTIASYLVLVLLASELWHVLIAGTSLAFAATAIGFNVMHDGGHNAFADSNRENHLAAMALDIIGGSSYMWRHKHTVLHHTYPNVADYDDDLEAGIWLRLSLAQKRYWFHRFQFIYAPLLYCFLVLKWHVFDDYNALAKGSLSTKKIPRPKGKELVIFFAGKAIFYTLAFVVPVLLGHSIWVVLATYACIGALMGVIMSVVFQMAHCVVEAEMLPDPGDGEVALPWAELQLTTTVDFAPNNRLACWYMGGLNFQVIHHLFPRISHARYPEIYKVVQKVCREHGVRYRQNPSVWAAIKSHAKFLKRMGSEDSPALGDMAPNEVAIEAPVLSKAA